MDHDSSETPGLPVDGHPLWHNEMEAWIDIVRAEGDPEAPYDQEMVIAIDMWAIPQVRAVVACISALALLGWAVALSMVLMMASGR